MENIDIGFALGVLGAYFAVLLVLAVAIETIIEPISMIRGLRKKISPDDFMKDVKEWIPPNSPAGTQAVAISAFIDEYNATVSDIDARVNEIKSIAAETAQAFGITDELKAGQEKLAIYMAEIRKKYNLDERKRITILRVISAVVGILLALWLRIDSFALLSDLLPKDFVVIPWLGMLVTGLAASAGSSFWHDMLGRVRAVKEASQQIKELTEKKQ